MVESKVDQNQLIILLSRFVGNRKGAILMGSINSISVEDKLTLEFKSFKVTSR